MEILIIAHVLHGPESYTYEFISKNIGPVWNIGFLIYSGCMHTHCDLFVRAELSVTCGERDIVKTGPLTVLWPAMRIPPIED